MNTQWASKQQKGFTLVELLIVIVVIAILAAIAFVAYSGVQMRARDSRRASDIEQIAKALDAYKAEFGNYPNAVVNSNGGFEVSTNPYGNESFLNTLVSAGVVSSIPTDPINTGDMTSGAGQYFYGYYRYAAGSYSCPTAFIVLLVRNGELGGRLSTSPNGSCGTYNTLTQVGAYWVELRQDS